MDVFDCWPWPEETSTTLIELMVVLCVVGSMVLTAVTGVAHIHHKIRALEALSLAPAQTIAMTEYRARHGVWPDSDEAAGGISPSGSVGSSRSRAAVREGAIDFHFTDLRTGIAGKVLTVRAWQAAGATDTPIVWACGRARAPSPLSASSDDRTTLAEDDIPSPCRHVR